MLDWTNCNPYLFRYSHLKLAPIRTDNRLSSKFNSQLAKPRTLSNSLCRFLGQSKCIFCASGGKGYPATVNLIGQYPIKPNAQKNKLQSRWQERRRRNAHSRGCLPKKRPLKSILLHMANLNGNRCNICGGMANHNGKYAISPGRDLFKLMGFVTTTLVWNFSSGHRHCTRVGILAFSLGQIRFINATVFGL